MGIGGAPAFAETDTHGTKDGDHSSASSGESSATAGGAGQGSDRTKRHAPTESGTEATTAHESATTSTEEQQPGTDTGHESSTESALEEHQPTEAPTTVVTRTVTGEIGTDDGTTEENGTTQDDGTTQDVGTTQDDGTDEGAGSTGTGADETQVSTYALQPPTPEAPTTDTPPTVSPPTDTPLSNETPSGSDTAASTSAPTPSETPAPVAGPNVVEDASTGNDTTATGSSNTESTAPDATAPDPVPDLVTVLEDVLTVPTVDVVEPPTVGQEVTLLAASTNGVDERRTPGRGPALSPLQILRLFAQSPGTPVPGKVADVPTLLDASPRALSEGPILAFGGGGTPRSPAPTPPAVELAPATALLEGIQMFLHDNAPIIVAVSLSAMFAAALPGLVGIIIPAVAGVSIGYRQAKALRTLRASGIGHLAMTGPLGVVRTGSLVSIGRQRRRASMPTEADAIQRAA